MTDGKVNSKPLEASSSWRTSLLRPLRAISIFSASIGAWFVARVQSLSVAARRTFSSYVPRLVRIRSLASSPSQRRAALQSRAWFWRVLRIWSKTRFQWLSLYVRGRDNLSAKISSGHLLRQFARLSLSRIVISLVIVFTCVRLDRILLVHTHYWKTWFGAYYLNADFASMRRFFRRLLELQQF